MTSTTDLSMCRVLLNILLNEISFYHIIECIVCTSIITNDSPKLLYNTIIYKDREKSSKLLVSTMICYYTKCKECNRSVRTGLDSSS